MWMSGREVRFFLVDVFAEQPLAGNPFGRVVQSVSMKQAGLEFGSVHSNPQALADALGLDAGDLDVAGLPAHVVSTGAPHLMVAADDRHAVDRARPDAERLAAELAALDGQGCYLFALDPLSDTAVAYARFFNPTVGIWEDPATGGAAGPLVCHLVKAAAVADGSDVVVEQGHCVGRPSRIHVRVEGENVRVSGAAVVAAEGTLRLPR
jgi:PhzF family phenazine biosynthesis protein